MGAQKVTLLVALDAASEQDRHGLAVVPVQTHLAVDAEALLEKEVIGIELVAEPVVPVVDEVQAEQVRGAVEAQQVGQLLVGVQPAALAVEGLVGDGQVLEQFTKAALTVAQILFGLLTGADVLGDAAHAAGRPVRVGEDPPGGADPVVAAIGPEDAELGGVIATFHHRLIEEGLDPGPVVRVHGLI